MEYLGAPKVIAVVLRGNDFVVTYKEKQRQNTIECLCLSAFPERLCNFAFNFLSKKQFKNQYLLVNLAFA